MNRDNQQLDVLLGRLREIPPAISPDATRDFLLSHLREHGQPYIPKSRFIPRPIILTGGVMALVIILILLFGIQSDPQVASTDHRFGIDSPPSSMPLGAGGDETNQPSGSIEQRLFTARPGSTSRADDSLNHLRLNTIFASWTQEQIAVSRVLNLDSAALRRIGIIVNADSSVFHKHPRTNPKSWIIESGMKEHADSGYVTYTWTFSRPDSTGKSSTAKAVQEDIGKNVCASCEPVLVTNSRGETFMRSTRSEKGEERPDVGTGRFSGGELVAVRVSSTGPVSASNNNTGEYYYLYWFEPTADFLAALPPDVRRSVERARGMEPSAEDAAMPLQPIALVGTRMHPNPATSNLATVEYTLSESRRVALTVYDITGGRLRDVAVSDTRASGTWQENVSFEGIPNGYYLLAVTTDRGEQRIQPFILKR